MNVAADLFEYLHSHDKAELPGLGTFYVQHHAAEISPLTGTIEPPCRKLTFKVEETNDVVVLAARDLPAVRAPLGADGLVEVACLRLQVPDLSRGEGVGRANTRQVLERPRVGPRGRGRA